MNVVYRVRLEEEERASLRALLARGRSSARAFKRAQILLAADAGVREEDIGRTVGVSAATMYRTKRFFVEEGLQAALFDATRASGPRKLSGKEEALLVATACSAPPAGRARWTLQLLADAMVRLTDHATLSAATVGRRLAEQQIKPWQEKMWCIPKVDGEYVARMEDVLDLYAEPPDAKRPVVCFDESPTQLIGEVRPPQGVKRGKAARVDAEYQRNGTANLFVMLDVHAGWRHVEVTERRTAEQFALQMKALVDEHYPQAEQIRLVMDNLNTHTLAALYDTFAPAEARRIARKLHIHYTPKHASWLNMVEIEIGVLKGQCLARRIAERSRLVQEVAAWESQRNAAHARVTWRFTTAQARIKLGRLYPSPAEGQADAAA